MIARDDTNTMDGQRFLDQLADEHDTHAREVRGDYERVVGRIAAGQPLNDLDRRKLRAAMVELRQTPADVKAEVADVAAKRPPPRITHLMATEASIGARYRLAVQELRGLASTRPYDPVTGESGRMMSSAELGEREEQLKAERDEARKLWAKLDAAAKASGAAVITVDLGHDYSLSSIEPTACDFRPLPKQPDDEFRRLLAHLKAGVANREANRRGI